MHRPQLDAEQYRDLVIRWFETYGCDVLSVDGNRLVVKKHDRFGLVQIIGRIDGAPTTETDVDALRRAMIAETVTLGFLVSRNDFTRKAARAAEKFPRVFLLERKAIDRLDHAADRNIIITQPAIPQNINLNINWWDRAISGCVASMLAIFGSAAAIVIVVIILIVLSIACVLFGLTALANALEQIIGSIR